MEPDRTTASRVVRALGLGATAELLDDVVATGIDRWLSATLAAAAAGTPASDPPELDVPPPPASSDRSARQAYRTHLRREHARLLSWWLTEMITTPQPALEKLTLGWHDHFATSVRKVRLPSLMLAQNLTLRRGATGSVDPLVRDLSRDPALLVWLDAVRSTSAAPNENLARELLELFCLGVGRGYTEADIKGGARALTGWRRDRAQLTVTYAAQRHDSSPVTVFGTTAPLDPDGFVSAVLARPEVSPHVVRRLWQRMVSDDPVPEEVLDRAVAALGPTRNVAGLLRWLLASQDFVAASGSRVTAPVEWAVGAARSLAVTPDQALVTRLGQALRALGQEPFAPPSVAGWPHGRAWLGTTGLDQRAALARRLVAAGDLSLVARAGRPARVEAAARLLGLPGFSARTRQTLESHAADPPALVVAALLSPENLVI